MASFGADGRCLMRALQEELDDPDPRDCGRCSVCAGPRYDAPPAGRARARGARAPALAPADARPEEDVAGRRRARCARSAPTCRSRRAARWRGSATAAGIRSCRPAAARARFDDELVRAAAALVRDWAPPVTWVAAVPSNRSGELVPGFARRLADALGLDVPRRARARGRPPVAARDGQQRPAGRQRARRVRGHGRPAAGRLPARRRPALQRLDAGDDRRPAATARRRPRSSRWSSRPRSDALERARRHTRPRRDRFRVATCPATRPRHTRAPRAADRPAGRPAAAVDPEPDRPRAARRGPAPIVDPTTPPVDPPPPVDEQPPFDPPGRDLPIAPGRAPRARPRDVRDARALRRRARPARRRGDEDPHHRRRHARAGALLPQHEGVSVPLRLRDARRSRSASSSASSTRVTYFRDDRSNLAGTIIANDRFEPTAGEQRASTRSSSGRPTRSARATSRSPTTSSRAAMPFAAGQDRLPPGRRHAGGALRAGRRRAARRPACARSSPPSCSRTSPTSR